MPRGGSLSQRTFVELSVLAALAALASCGPKAPPAHEHTAAIVWKVGPPLPRPVADNAVAALSTDGGVAVFSFLGIDSTKTWAGVTDAAYRWDVGSPAWKVIAPVPGPGRLGATAQVVKGRVYVVGGYVLGKDGSERSVSTVDVYDPATNRWSRGPDMPIAVHDAASGVWRDSLVLVLGGRNERGGVREVQWYDPARRRWLTHTELPGKAVFGAGGTIVGGRAVLTDGAWLPSGGGEPEMDTTAWSGRVRPNGADSIAWHSVPRHPGPLVYGAAGGTLGTLALFVDGAARPQAADGTGRDGKAVQPLRQVLSFDAETGVWRDLASPPVATMDHTTLGVAGGMVFLVGGMVRGARVSNTVWYVDVQDLLTAG